MAWYQPAGVPEWSGKDSIINAKKDAAQATAVMPTIVGMIAVIIIFINPRESFPYTVAVALVAWCPFIFAYRMPEFVGSEWGLCLAGGSLDFVAKKSEVCPAQRWAVRVDDVASVEIGRTRDYNPTRSGFGAVSEYEWQVFLFLKDGTRRAIYHANADRDGCAALRASIAGAVEAVRSAARPAPAAPAQASQSLGEGFNL